MNAKPNRYARLTDAELRRAPYSTSAEIDEHDDECGYRDGLKGKSVRACRSAAYERGLARARAA